MTDPRKFLVNLTTRTVHSTKSKRAECQPRESDNIGYSDFVKTLKGQDLIFCSCT
ncbi:hypothetical protein LCGC14_2764720 [marine sediment metagenome]|uniref:Uncharacterized protein n=1 Tax=marine sediment metagenome TaxID=412755 RepID=A0A0F8ZJS9_9ZZZZ